MQQSYTRYDRLGGFLYITDLMGTSEFDPSDPPPGVMPSTPLINVADPPAGYTPLTGDDSTDNAAALQALANANLGALWFPKSGAGGRYRIGSTVTWPYDTGVPVLYGSGSPQLLDPGNVRIGNDVAIVWSGADGGTMLKFQGDAGHISNISLWGKARTTLSDQAGIGIQVARPSAGLGTGKYHFDHVRVESCDTAIEYGGGANGDESVFTMCYARDCGTFFKATGNQNVGFLFLLPKLLTVTTGWDFTNGGGDLTVIGTSIVSDNSTILQVRGVTSGGGFYSFDGIKLDANIKTTVELFDVTDSGTGSVHVHFDKCNFDGATAITALMDRSGGTGASIVTLDRIKALSNCTNGIKLVGNATNPAHMMITRSDSMATAANRIDATSVDYTFEGRWNYANSSGITADESTSG